MSAQSTGGPENPADRWWLDVATVGPLGNLPSAPGTWCSLAAAVSAPFLFEPLPLVTRLILLAVLFFLGSRASGRAEIVLGEKDPGRVVVDELFGQWLTFLPFASLPVADLLAGFILFRVFDIFKPPPVRASENWLSGGYGVMIDDGLAAVYAMAGLWLWRMVSPLSG
ncbi:MAG: phosphatidylglycerophosphatase A [Desulfovibrionaceae bacterium]|nr:phosphatidylglycerophosphatase A [Desulfovibrionaceae bacterium]MBF0513445.1 phosphatidylglycerophosphatase A [Desulfovibrionaceae bacterium]